MVAVETKYDGEGQGSGKVPANSGRSTQRRELLLDSALSIFPPGIEIEGSVCTGM